MLRFGLVLLVISLRAAPAEAAACRCLHCDGAPFDDAERCGTGEPTCNGGQRQGLTRGKCFSNTKHACECAQKMESVVDATSSDYRQHGEICADDGGRCIAQTGATKTNCAKTDNAQWNGRQCMCDPGYCAIHNIDRHGHFFAGAFLLQGYEFDCYEIAKDSIWSSDSCCSRQLKVSIVGWGEGNYDGTCDAEEYECSAPGARCDKGDCVCEAGCASWTNSLEFSSRKRPSPYVGMFICDAALGGALATAQPLSIAATVALAAWTSAW